MYGKEVAAVVKTAFAKLANCPTFSKAEIKDILSDNHENTDMSSERDTEFDSETRHSRQG